MAGQALLPPSLLCTLSSSVYPIFAASVFQAGEHQQSLINLFCCAYLFLAGAWPFLCSKETLKILEGAMERLSGNKGGGTPTGGAYPSKL